MAYPPRPGNLSPPQNPGPKTSSAGYQAAPDNMLDGLITQPTEAPTPSSPHGGTGGQTGDWGGLHTWWGGAGGAAPAAPTTGYGSYAPNPNPVNPPPAPVTPATETPATPAQPATPTPPPQQSGADMARQRQIVALQQQIQQYQLQAAQYPPGDPYGDKIRTYMQQAMIKLQQARAGTLQSV